MSRASSPPNPLVISVSLAARRTMTVRGSPVPCMAARNPSAIERTAVNTMTTPAMPMTATVDDPETLRERSQCDPGDGDCLSKPVHDDICLIGPREAHPRSSGGSPEAPGSSRAHAESKHEQRAEDQVARREVEDWKQPASRIPAEGDERPRDQQSELRRRESRWRRTRAAPATRFGHRRTRGS